MFDNKTLKVQSAREMLFLRLKCVCVCVCVCVCARRAPKQTSKVHSELRAQTHTICKNGRLGEYSLKHSLYVKVNENSWEKIVCQYFVLVTDWTFFNVNQRTKYKDKIIHSS